MSIKYLGDNQLNQILNDPNDTPWAKLIAQSEMLERNKMRQPQGQFPQGTVASAIQQQLLNDQMRQANQVQGLDAEKARILAQLINSGQLQGMAGGGLTPSMSNPQLAPMLGASPIKPQVAQTQLAPTKEAIDQQPHHDIFQRLLDNSIVGAVQGKGSLNDTLQLYADMWTGKALKGLADGGEVRRFTEGGTLFEQLQRLKTQMAGAGQGWTPEAAANYKSAYTPELVAEMRRRGLNPSGQPLSMSDIMNRPPVSTPSAPQTTAPQSAFRAEVPRLHIGSGLPPDLIAETHAEMRPELVGPRRGAAMSSPEAQAYLRDPTSIKATPISEFVGPQTAQAAKGSSTAADAWAAGGAEWPKSKLLGALGRAAEAVSLPASIYGAGELYAADPRLLMAAAGNEKAKAGIKSGDVRLPGVLEGLLTHGLKSGPAFDAYRYIKDKLNSSGAEQPTAPTNQPAAPTATPASQPAAPTAAPASQPTTAPTTQTQAVTKQAATRDNAKQIAQVHGYEKQDSALLNKAQQLGALAQTEDAVTQTAGDNIVDMLHKRLKDADVDYMELAKRISENEKDLAQERKDGALTAVLTGVGAALSRAGTLEQKGDRVFTPGIGQILGAGILGGIESSEATDKKYRTGIEKNLEALNALQTLKRATANDLMDAYSAERQNATLAQHYKSIEDIAQQKLPAEIENLQATATYHKAMAGAADRRGTETTGGGKPLTQAQKASILNAATDDVMRQLEKDNTYMLMSENDKLAAKTRAIQNEYDRRIATAMGSAVAAPATDAAAEDFTGFIKLSSRPAK